MTIGMGRVKKQYIVAIDDLLNSGEFAHIPEFVAGIAHCKKNHSNLHLIQIFGPGGVHGYDQHLKKILALIPTDVPVYLHLLSDGRDLGPKSALDLMQDFQIFLQKFSNVTIASLA
jgi:2,3-bisphosphoglycerate-independent phosphoglycerate mutase